MATRNLGHSTSPRGMFRKTNTTILLFQFPDTPPPFWHTAVQRKGATHAAIADRLMWIKFHTWEQAYQCWKIYKAPPENVHAPIASPAHSGHQEFIPGIQAMITRMKIPKDSVKIIDLTKS